MNKHLPKGFGFYLRRMSSKPSTNDINLLIDRLKTAKASWVSLMVESEDGFINPLSNLKAFADVIQQNGIEVWVWTFPGSKRASSVSESESAAMLANSCCNGLNAKGIMLDVEVAYKGKQKALNAFVGKSIRLTNYSNFTIGFVSYPIPSFHKDIDWNCLKQCDFGSPMIYDSAKTKTLIDKSYNEYVQYNSIWIPSLATYETQRSEEHTSELQSR